MNVKKYLINPYLIYELFCGVDAYIHIFCTDHNCYAAGYLWFDNMVIL